MKALYWGMAALALDSLAVNAALWHDRRAKTEEIAKLEAEVLAVTVARSADECARNLREGLQGAIDHDLDEKMRSLEQLAEESAELDDADFLRRLRGMLAGSAPGAPDAAGEPACAVPGAANAAGPHERQ